MPLFEYRARSPQGQLVNGRLEAVSRDTVASQLIDGGITPLVIERVADSALPMIRLQHWLGGSKVEIQELVMFARQMYTITKAGIPLIAAIRGLEASMQHHLMKKALMEIADGLETGMELSAAMGRHPNVFDDLFIGIVSIGESSGRLEEAFDQLSEYLERDMETARRIKSALRYPGFVAVALAVAIVIINIWVIPAFGTMFARFNAELPLTTRILLGTSDLFVNFWPFMLMVLIAVIFGLRHYMGTPQGKVHWGRLKLRLPVVGDIINRGSMARYSRSFALMMRSGVPLPQALGLCAQIIDNPHLGAKIQEIRAGVERGESLLQTHAASQMFSPLVLQMIGVGEESGSVDDLLRDVAEFYEREVDYDLKSLSDKIEPLLIVVMAGFVLILALGIFLPMWGMYAIQT
ncbi:MAG: type II secretion system F family protein [Gammaproteobacteria bacterium]|nr:type II secretion system F family protein [Gammaproteobacteria bacterium]